MVNNTAAVMTGAGPEADVEFHVRHDDEGQPTALIVPDEGSSFFWINAAAPVHDQLLMFLVQIEKHGEGTFGFREIAR